MKILRIAFILAVIAAAVTPLKAADIEKQGKELLENADKRFYPYEGTFDFIVRQKDAEGNTTEFGMQGYKKGNTSITGVLTKPEIDRNDVGMRCQDTIYYKPHTWPKPQIESYTAAFMSTTFSWGDVLTSDIAIDYKTSSLETTNIKGINAWHLVLLPKREDLYARIDMWIDAQNYNTYKRLYFTASGDKLKTADYSDIKEENGMVTSFKVDMQDFIQDITTYAEVGNIRTVKLPGYLFDPQNIGRIRVR